MSTLFVISYYLMMSVLLIIWAVISITILTDILDPLFDEGLRHENWTIFVVFNLTMFFLFQFIRLNVA